MTTVGELKEILDGFGDHLDVVLVVTRGDSESYFDEFEVDTQTTMAGISLVQRTFLAIRADYG